MARTSKYFLTPANTSQLTAHLDRGLVGLRLDREGLPDPEVPHVGHHAGRAVDPPGALGLVGVFSLSFPVALTITTENYNKMQYQA